MYKLKEKDKAAFPLPLREVVMPVTSMKEPEENELVVDSSASMHMVSKRDLNSAELETMRMSRNPMTVMTANGEVQTREEATVYVKELDLFVTVMLLEEKPSVLEDHGYTYHWTSGQKPHLTQNGKNIKCNISNYLPLVAPGLSMSSSTSPSPTSSTSSSQDSVIGTENPAIERSGSTSADLRRTPLHRLSETNNTNKNEKAKKYRAIYYMNCRTGCRSSEKIWSMKVVL